MKRTVLEEEVALMEHHDDDDKSTRTKRYSEWIPARYVFTILSSLGIINVYAMRVNLSVALIAMVNATTPDNTSYVECPINDTDNGTSTSKEQVGEFDWDENIQGIILGSFFAGYIVTQLPGGRMAEIYSGKWIFGIGILCTAVFTLLTPVAARAGYGWLVAVRIVEGLGEGVTFPTMHAMISRWCPPHERSRIVTIIFAGSLLGTVIGLPVSGWLAEYGFAGGWPSIFYVFGICGIVWFIFWMMFAYDSPDTHPYISQEEKDYIKKSLGFKKHNQTPPVPWRQVITSLPMWAIIVSHFCHNWGFYTLLTELPTYLKTILHYDMQQNGLMSALPYLMGWIFSTLCSIVCDMLIKHEILSTTTARRLFQFFGHILPAACMLGVTWTGCNQEWPFALLVLSVMISGATYAGFQGNHIDIAPNFAGTLLGITNTVATIPGFMGPYTVGSLTKGNPYRREWNKVFYIAAGIYIFSSVFYAIFGRGYPQSWNKLTKDDQFSDEKIHEEKGDTTDEKVKHGI